MPRKRLIAEPQTPPPPEATIKEDTTPVTNAEAPPAAATPPADPVVTTASQDPVAQESAPAPEATPAAAPSTPAEPIAQDTTTSDGTDIIETLRAENAKLKRQLSTIESQNDRLKAARREVDQKKVALAGAKADYEKIADQLSQIIDEEPEGTLFDSVDEDDDDDDFDPETPVFRGDSDDATAPAPAGDPDAWRSHLISELGLPEGLVNKISDKVNPGAGVATMGQVQDYNAKHRGMNDIPGVGEAKQAQYADAFIAWCAANPTLCPPIGGGEKKPSVFSPAYDAGLKAAKDPTLNEDSNPFAAGTVEAADWEDGFDQGSAESKGEHLDGPTEGGGVPGPATGLGDAIADAAKN